MKRDTDERLAEVHNTSEAVRRLLIVIVAPYPSSTFLDNLLSSVQVPIEKVHFANRSPDPCASVHPQSALVRSRDNRDRSDCAESLCDRSHLSHRKRGCLAIVNANVDVGIGSRQAASVSPTQDNSNHV
jgi:hypothetical protein